MARIRSIKPAFFTSEDTTSLSPLARLLFLGLLTEADRAGRLEDLPRQLKRRLLPDDVCDVDGLLWELAAGRLIRRYESGELRIIQIVKFEKHQKPHPKEAQSQLPATGQERKPGKETASREEVSTHPVENPSCPARNGSGDLGSGDSGVLYADTHTPRRSGQGQGAFTPGSLPRDHMRHAVCGPAMRVCLTEAVAGKFVRRWGSDEVEATAALRRFVEAVETEVGDGPLGDGLWLERHFDAFLAREGRTPKNPTKGENFDDVLDKWALS